MFVYNAEDPVRRQFANNICAFHIGNGVILSVAHNLRTESGIINSIDESIYQSEILPRLNPGQNHLFSQWYPEIKNSARRYLNNSDQNNFKIIKDTLRQIGFDTRWITMTEKKICRPYLIVQFSEQAFYADSNLTSMFDSSKYFFEPSINRHTFLLELELSETFFSNDIALYKIINTDLSIIKNLPFIMPDLNIYDEGHSDYYCLQSAPVGNLGRLLNIAHIEGFLDHHAVFKDTVGGNYIIDGLRYLIKGYFRFGSSGAPYVVFDNDSGKFKVNAIQSEASPIQLSINNNREGNYQYVNAIASPLKNIQESLNKKSA
jgi:hypothetical protein